MSAAGRLSGIPITINDTPNISIHQVASRCRNLQRSGKCGIVFIDYLQLLDMRMPGSNYTREQEVSQTSRAAKNMAKQLDIPVILLSQLSRKLEDRGDKVPMLSDLRESGAIEQDADIVLFPHRPDYYDRNITSGVGILRLAKHRAGRTGDTKFRYNASMTRFDNDNDADDAQKPF